MQIVTSCIAGLCIGPIAIELSQQSALRIVAPKFGFQAQRNTGDVRIYIENQYLSKHGLGMLSLKLVFY